MTKRMSDLSYWQRRFLLIKRNRDVSEANYLKELTKRHGELSAGLKKQITTWVERYAENDQISVDEARALLTKSEQKTWQMRLEEYRQKAIEGGYDQELNREYYRSRISRLEQLQRQLYFELADQANVEEKLLKEWLIDQFGDTYMRTIFELTDRGSFALTFAHFDRRALEVIISKPWVGSDFSKRVWKNYLKVIPEKLSKTLAQATVQGWGIDKTVDAMMVGVDQNLRNRMITLVQTETAHIAEVANDRSMEETGVEQVQWLATLEINTCEECGHLDGQVFDLDDSDAPTVPKHPNCRCTRVPYIAGWVHKTRWQRDLVTGKGSIVEYQSFDEWKENQLAA